LLNYEGMEEITENPVTSDYLKNLILKNKDYGKEN
jgi:hypothetical protein